MINLYLHSFSLRCHFRFVDDFDVFSFIDRTAAWGFSGVSISANRPGYRHLCGTTPEHFEKVREHIVSHQLLCDLDTSGTSPDHLRTLLEIAQAVGASKLRTYTRHSGSPEEMIALSVRDLKEVAPIAEETGVTVMFENHEDFTGPQVARILNEVDSPWVRALYDYGNSMMVLEDPLEALEAMGEFAVNAHLKDHVMVSPEHSPDGKLSVLGVPIGQGNLPIVEITRRLINAGTRDITFENVWGYRAPVKVALDTNTQLGSGVFSYATPPFEPECALPGMEALAEKNPQQFVALENAVMDDGVEWLKRELRITQLIT